jgi:hypothetical protein
MQRNSDYVDKLEEKLKSYQDRELLWLKLAEDYAYILRKIQLGKTVNAQNWQELQDVKNKLGIGNGLMR